MHWKVCVHQLEFEHASSSWDRREIVISYPDKAQHNVSDLFRTCAYLLFDGYTPARLNLF